MELRKKILVVLMAFSLLFVGGAGWYFYGQSAAHLQHELDDQIERSAFLFSQRLVEQSNRLGSQARLIAGMPFMQAVVASGDMSRIRQAVGDFIRDAAADLVMIRDRGGRPLASLWSARQADGTPVPAENLPPEGAFAMASNGLLFHAVSVPMEVGGHRLGYVTLAVALGPSFLDDIDLTGPAGFVLLLDEAPVARSSNLEGLPLETLDVTGLERGRVTVQGISWRSRVSAPQALLSGRVRVAVVASETEEKRDMTVLRVSTAATVLGGLGLLWLLGWLFARNLTAPLERLTAVADRVAKGGAEMDQVDIPRSGVGEIGALARAFSTMLDAVQSRDRQLTRQMHDLTALREGASDAIFILDMSCRVVSANGKACQWTGRLLEELKGVNFCELVTDPPPPEADPLANPEALAGEVVFETTLSGADGRTIPVEVSAAPVPGLEPPVIQLFVRDLTERHRFQEQLLRAQKLEALGTLAGGIAHDFNNILTGIGGHSALARMDLPEDHSAQQSLATVEEAVERGAELCRQLLGTARKGGGKVGPLSTTMVVKEVTALCRETFSPAISWQLKLGDRLPDVDADAGQLHQVLMNLLVNARDAIGDAPGTITVTTALHEGDPPAALTGDAYVTIAIGDTGPGIDKRVVSRIFDPFFTTKEVGKGTGLGLSTVFGIVHGHGGTVTVDSEPGEGAVFTCYLPVSVVAPNAPKESALPPPAAAAPTGRQILVVDDEASVRELMRGVLESAGHRVLLAANGDRAVELVKGDISSTGPEIDLAIIDMLMPGLNGVQTATRLREAIPDLPILFATGYSGDEVELGELGTPTPIVLDKPFRMEQLIRTVNDTLRVPDTQDTARSE